MVLMIQTHLNLAPACWLPDRERNFLDWLHIYMSLQFRSDPAALALVWHTAFFQDMADWGKALATEKLTI